MEIPGAQGASQSALPPPPPSLARPLLYDGGEPTGGPMNESLFNLKVSGVAGLATAGLAVVLCLAPIPQDPAFHDFADARTLLGVPNFWNVLSNLPFLLAGAWGLHVLLLRKGGRFHEAWERWPYAVLLASIFAVGIGSSYYHWAPTTERLFWDRLPMTLMFSSFLAITVTERLRPKWGARLLLPLLAAGVGSLLWWRSGEARGEGDLRFYGLLQGFAMVGIPLMLVLFRPRYTRSADMFFIVTLYGIAKACEAVDGPMDAALGGALSGHTIKHLLGGVAACWIVVMLLRRRPLAASASEELEALPSLEGTAKT